MYTRTDLLDICFSLGVSADEEKFYRFAQEYLFGIIQRGGNVTEFFNVITFCSNKSDNSEVLRKVGISGNGENGGSRQLTNWCKKLLGNSEITKLNLNELNMLMVTVQDRQKLRKADYNS